MKNLRSKDLIIMDEDGHIHLTPSGLAIAAKIYERHTLLSKLLIMLESMRKLPLRMPAAWSTSSARKVLKPSRSMWLPR